MTDLSSLHDDEIVAEMQMRLARGTVGYHGLFSPHQINYRAKYHEVCMLSARWNNESIVAHDNRYVRELRNLLDEIGREQPGDIGVFAVNTTFHGRAANEDHAPRQEAA